MSPLTVMTIDDEPLALRRLELAIAEVPGFVHVAEADGCGAGLSRFEECRPDIVIVDIKMRDGTGFDFVDRLKAVRSPAIIFATAFDHFAARAFETPAVDYVLKPIEIPRLRAALHRARARLADGAAATTIAELRAVVANLRRAAPGSVAAPGEREVWVRSNRGMMTRVAISDIRFVTSEDDYVRLHLADRSFLVRMSIRAFAEQVSAEEFIRIHRRALVRRSEIVDVARAGSRIKAVLADGRTVEAGRIYARSLLDMTRRARLD
ncbi:LytTR family DNA-binding domain-containing protein [Sphingomonas sp.]|uniref:LytR/AlgR family response regulator transcription factor n=1 Tax=Sphingomonas sp. TaxID=28214 RepID=UPI0031E477CC